MKYMHSKHIFKKIIFIFLFFICIFLNHLSFANENSLKEIASENLRKKLLEEVFLEFKNNSSIKNLSYLKNSEKIFERLVEKTNLLPKELQDELIYPFHKKIKQVVAGKYNAFILVESGEVYSFGDGTYGRLGHNNQEKQVLPKKIEALIGLKIIKIAIGGFHTLALTETGEVYSFGNEIKGHLGHGNLEKQWIPKKIEAIADVKITQVATGETHSLALTDDGKMYSFGSGHSGQLGHGDHENQIIPKKIEALEDVEIVQILAIEHHSLALSKTGKVYTFGSGTSGQLGHGDLEPQLIPKKIETIQDVKIVQIAADAYHTLLLAETGEVYSFGNWIFGQLGYITKDSQLIPKKIEALQNSKVIQIAAGLFSSFILTETGEAYSFGQGQSGQLGHGNKKNQWIPKKINALKNLKVTQIAAGVLFSLIVAETGDVYSFGDGEFGQLGHGDCKQKKIPTLIERMNLIATLWNQFIN